MDIEKIKELDTFEKRYNYDFTKYIEEKEVKGKSKVTGSTYSYKLKYLSWSYVQKIAMILDPNFKWEPVKNEETKTNIQQAFAILEGAWSGTGDRGK